MIPKIIHYCWFGNAPLPSTAHKCLESWKKYLPEYEIILWNEENSPMKIPFVRDAYKAKKYAFVADYVRIWLFILMEVYIWTQTCWLSGQWGNY